MARIVCLANSTKHNGRCIAGVDVETGKWIRPVYHNDPAAGINYEHRDIGGEPRLLDIIEMNVDGVGPPLGFQPENRSLLKRK